MTERADMESGAVDVAEPSPGRRLRDLVDEASGRGAPMVSSHAMQSRLFSVYDDAAAVPEALALVQRHLGLTLDRTWYSEREVETLAEILDGMLDGVTASATGDDGDVIAVPADVTLTAPGGADVVDAAQGVGDS